VASYLAGVDIGTSEAKGMVFDLAGKPLANAWQEYPCTYPRPGWVEQDADHQVEATKGAMARAVVIS
jgi:xylulokinase